MDPSGPSRGYRGKREENRCLAVRLLRRLKILVITLCPEDQRGAQQGTSLVERAHEHIVSFRNTDRVGDERGARNYPCRSYEGVGPDTARAA